jgi:hypothetical protein
VRCDLGRRPEERTAVPALRVLVSGKLISGLFGGGLGSMVVAAWGYNGAYGHAGGVSMVAAVIAPLLRQPGRDAARAPHPQIAG